MNIRGWSPPEWEKRQDEHREEQYEEDKRFRNVYVIKPGPYNLTTIKPLCQRIVYATDGYAEDVMGMYRQLQEGLAGFDPNRDLLIAVGSANACALAATIIARLIVDSDNKQWDSYCLAVYTSQSYLFWRVPVRGPLTEPYEFTDR